MTSRLVFGEHVICKECDGTGERSKLTAEDRQQRNRDLAKAKRLKVDPPPLVKSTCKLCMGLGYIAAAIADRTPKRPAA